MTSENCEKNSEITEFKKSVSKETKNPNLKIRLKELQEKSYIENIEINQLKYKNNFEIVRNYIIYSIIRENYYENYHLSGLGKRHNDIVKDMLVDYFNKLGFEAKKRTFLGGGIDIKWKKIDKKKWEQFEKENKELFNRVDEEYQIVLSKIIKCLEEKIVECAKDDIKDVNRYDFEVASTGDRLLWRKIQKYFLSQGMSIHREELYNMVTVKL